MVVVVVVVVFIVVLLPFEIFATITACGTKAGLGSQVAGREDVRAIEFGCRKDSPILSLEGLRLFIKSLPLRITQHAIRGLCGKLTHAIEKVLEREVALSATLKKLMLSLTLRVACV